MDKMIGFALSPWSGPQNRAGIRREGFRFSGRRAWWADPAVTGSRLSVVRGGMLTLLVKSGGNGVRDSSGLQLEAPPSCFLKKT